ncbi:Coproporphyrinogen-III oxidase [Rhizina undulata]
MEQFIKEKQKEIVSALEFVDGQKFLVDTWERPEHGGGDIPIIEMRKIVPFTGAKKDWQLRRGRYKVEFNLAKYGKKKDEN